MLEADPELGSGIDRSQWNFAVDRSIATTFEHERGPWLFQPPSELGGLGALILEGLLLLRIDAGTRGHAELLGAGDVIAPWVDLEPDLTVPAHVSARVVEHARLALLDRGFALRVARWPEISSALMARQRRRTRMLGLQSAINSLSRVEERVELTLWQLAYRFGRVTPAGIALRLPLTHSQLAAIVAAQRPSVSTAVSRLERQGRLIRAARHSWLLVGQPPDTLTRQRHAYELDTGASRLPAAQASPA